jgi:cleavage and polyadenylation specificity factor subunit 1
LGCPEQFSVWDGQEVSASSVTLAYLAKDYYAACTSCTQFLSDGRSLVLASADLDKNVQFFQYEPSQASSDNTLAMPLDRKADFHLGSTVCRMVRTRHDALLLDAILDCSGCFFSVMQASVGLNATVWGGYHATSVRFGAVFGTVDGGVGSFVPVDEVQFKRLIALQKLMTYALPHAAGLNPKDHRLFRSVESKRLVRNKNVVDGNLVWRCGNPQLSVLPTLLSARLS